MVNRGIYFKVLIIIALGLFNSAFVQAQEPGPGPITPEGEIEDHRLPIERKAEA